MDRDLDPDLADEEFEQHFPILRFFALEHLRQDLRETSRPFRELAWQLVRDLPWNAETLVALRKLLEAKDAAVRSAVSRRLS